MEEDNDDLTVDTKDNDLNQFDSVSNVPEKVKDAQKKVLKDTTNTMASGDRDSKSVSVVSNNIPHSSSSKPKKVKKSIFISYSPDAGFTERKFVVDTVRQLKENNLAEDIWFDKDEQITDSPSWFSQRMEAIEKSRAALLFFSPSYFSCPVSMYEGRTLLERRKFNSKSVAIFPILVSSLESVEIPNDFQIFVRSVVDLTKEHAKKSIAEKASVVIGHIMEELERFACMNVPLVPNDTPDTDFTGQYKKKKICQWSAADLQEWLYNLNIKEFYRQSLAETMVDGFLLMSLTDQDMIQHLGIDSRVVRKKIMQHILSTLDNEHKDKDNWHLRARAMRSKPDVIYLIYDPTDVRLAQNMKADLKKKHLQVTKQYKK